MNEFKKFFRKYQKQIILLLVGVIFATLICPIIINLLFKIVAPHNFFVAEWSADAALEYCGAILTFWGTSMLSALALWQSHIIKVENDRYITKLQQIEEKKNYPYFIVNYISSLASYSQLEFNVENITTNIAFNVEIYNFIIKDSTGKIMWKSEERITKAHLCQPSIISVQLKNNNIESTINYLYFNLVFFNDQQEKHEVQVKSLLKDKCICCLENKKISTNEVINGD